MQSKGNKLVAIIFLVVGLVFLLCGVILLQNSASGSYDSAEDDTYYFVLACDGTENLGGEYQGVQAQAGYSFHRLDFSVTNAGNTATYHALPSLYYEADPYDAVLEEYEWQETDEEEDDEEEPLFSYASTAIVPAGRTAAASEVVQVKDGLASFQIYYYPNYDSEEAVLDVVVE